MGSLIIPDSVFGDPELSPAELRVSIAFYLFLNGRLNLADASSFAALSPDDFKKRLEESGLYTATKIGKPHFLSKMIGALDKASGDELENIISTEFQKIEGEW